MKAKSWKRWGVWLAVGLLGGLAWAEENAGTPAGEGAHSAPAEASPAAEGTDPYQLGTERFSLAKETRLAVGDDGSSGAVAEIEKEFGVVQDEALIKRVSEIGAKIVAAAERVGPRQIITDRVAPGTEAPKLQFTFKVLNSPEVNAFSIWGGRLYVTKGLLDYVQSDDELAAVMSHEMGHTMRHHLNKQQRIEETATNYQLWTIVAGWLGGNSVDLESVLLTSEWVKYAILSKYSVHDEAEADYLGVLYCHAAGYNPVGLLTFMQRLARDTYNQPNIEGGRDQPGPGATQTHPWSKDRAQAIRHQIIDQLHLPIKYQAVIALPRIEARATTVNGTEIAEVLFEGAVIFQPADKGAQESPLARAQALADELLRLMKEQDLHARHLRLEAQKPLLKAFLRGKYVPVLEVLPGDAEFHRKEARALAQEAFQTLRGAMQGYELRNQKI